MTAPPLWDRLARLLHKEHHAILLSHRDLMTLPLDERVERGDSLAGLAYRGEEAGRISLRCADNLAKYRIGESLRLGNGERVEGSRGLGVTYESFDDATGTLIVSRDPFRTDGTFDPSLPLQLDPEAQSLTGLALEGLARVRSGRSASAAAVRAVLEGVATRTVDQSRRVQAEAQARVFVPTLDASQQEAFVAAMAADPVTLVQGPPGTGKTSVLARIVSALASRGLRVLVATYTHRAVNNALRMVAATDAEIQVVKAGKASGADDLRGTRIAVLPSIARLPGARDTRRVVGATLFSLRAVWEENVFDVVVVDEAAQIPLAYACCALLAAPRYVLVGDHRQLGPIVQGRHADALAMLSLFEHLAAAYPPALLRTTYRMNTGLNDFPSRVFYDGRLAPAARAACAPSPACRSAWCCASPSSGASRWG